MTSVTVLGLGPMGRALSGALLGANHHTTVWNRSESKAEVLRARGAVWARTPAQAVATSDVTLINVVDHDVVDALVAQAGDAVDGRVIVGLSTDTPDRARHTAKLVADLGGRYLDGAIMTPTPTIGHQAAVYFSRDRSRHSALIARFSNHWARRRGWGKTMGARRRSTCHCSTYSGRRSAGSCTQ